MKFNLRFPGYVLATVVGVGAIVWYPLMIYGSPEMYPGIIAGCVLSIFNVIIGYCTVEYSFDKSNETFLKYVLGGMMVRLVGTAGAVLLLIFVYEIHITGLVVSLFFFYFLFLVYEIIYYNKKLALKKGEKH